MSALIRRGAAFCAATTLAVLCTSGVAGAAVSFPAPRVNPAPIPAAEVIRTADGKIDNPRLTMTHPASASLSQGPVPNPWGCQGKTDFPHESGGESSTHARTTCTLTAPHVSVTSQMYRGRFYGAQAVGDQVASARDVSNTSKDAVARWGCQGVGTYTYATDSYHEAGNGANTYIAYTGNSARFAC